MKSAIVAKVAAQASDLYREAMQACQVSSVRQQLEKVIFACTVHNIFIQELTH